MSGLREYLVQKRDALLARRESAQREEVGLSSITVNVPGVLESCLTHTFLMQAVDRQVPLDGIEVAVMGQFDARADRLRSEGVTVSPHNIQYTVRINSPASDAELTALHEAVERACTVLSERVHPRQISGSILRTTGVTVNSVTVGARMPVAAIPFQR
jgi:hypothetical protein